MEHYLAAGSGVLVLCGNETRARNFHRASGGARRARTARSSPIRRCPPRARSVIGLGALSAGCEYPQLRLVILTEGQLLAPVSGKAPRAVRQKKDSSRQKLRSYTDLTPGDLVVHQRHGIGRFVGMEQHAAWTARTRIISRSPTPAATACTFPRRSSIWCRKYIGSHGGGEEGEHVKLNKLGGDGLDEGQIPRQGRGEGSCQGAHQALRRAAAPPRLRLFAGLHLAARV